MPVFFHFLVMSLLLLGSSCAQLDSWLQTSKDEQTRVIVAAGVETQDNKEEIAPEAKDKDFPPETLYALMLAEIAIERDAPDIALTYYRREAYRSRDPGVIHRALEISSWLEAHQVSMELMALWQDAEPYNPVAHQVMAQQQLYFGMVFKALDSVERVLSLGADFNFDYFNQVVEKLPEPEEDWLTILKRLEELSERFPDNSQLYLSRATVHALLDQRKQALDTAEKAMKLDKRDVRPLLKYAELQFNYNDHDKALKRMQKGIRQFPDSKLLHYLYAESLLKLGKQDKARESINDSVALFPREIELHFRLAVLAHAYQMNELASQLFHQQLQYNYRQQEAYFYLSRIAKDAGQLEQAIDYLHRIKPGAGFVEARLEIAYLLYEQGQEQAAFDSLDEAHFLQAENEGIFFQAKADLLRRARRPEEALSAYGQALALYPDSVKLLYARAMLAESMDRLDIAEGDLRKILGQEPDNAMALNALGYTLTNKTTRHKEALQLIEKAYELSPNDPAIIDSMGWVHYRLGNYEMAISYLRKAMAMDTDHEIAAHLGEVLWVAGEHQEAERIWNEALGNHADSDVLKSVMGRFLQ